MKWVFVCIFPFLLTVSGIAKSEIVSAVADERELTIYRDETYSDFYQLVDNGVEDAGLAMVTEYRDIQLDEGENIILLKDIVDGIIPQTLNISDIENRLQESSFTYNLLTPSDLLFHSLNQPVLLVRTNSKTGEIDNIPAIIRSSSEKILLEIDRKLESLGCQGHKEKLVFSKIPHGLVQSPQLKLSLQAEQAQKIRMKISYLVVGMQWKANYTALLNFSKKTFDLSAWVTLLNARSTRFTNTSIQVVAGRLETDWKTRPPMLEKAVVNTKCWPASLDKKKSYFDEGDVVEEVIVTGVRASMTRSEELGDYKLYIFPHKTELEARQAKQVMMLNKNEIPFKLVHEYSFAFADMIDDYETERLEFANAKLITKNSKDNNLEIPIPAGEILFYEKVDDTSILINQEYSGEVKDVSSGAPIKWDLAEDHRVSIYRTYTKQEGSEENPLVTFELLVENEKLEAVELKIKHYNYDLYRVKKIKYANARSDIEDDSYSWKLQLPPQSKVRFKAKVELVENQY
jgi:hypothetical protein